jgi:hypothetical protein
MPCLGFADAQDLPWSSTLKSVPSISFLRIFLISIGHYLRQNKVFANCRECINVSIRIIKDHGSSSGTSLRAGERDIDQAVGNICTTTVTYELELGK